MYDVLCAAFVGFGVLVPGAYGMKSAFHGYVPRVFGLLKTPGHGEGGDDQRRTRGRGAAREGRQMRIFADANCASAPLVTRSTKIGIWIGVFR